MNNSMGNTTGNNKKTIIFQTPEIKSFCDALVQAKSKKTGISIMRLIENALLNEFGFKNGKFNDWCCEYCVDSATTSYMSLLSLLQSNDDIFVLYKTICRHTDISIKTVMNNSAVSGLSQNGNFNISDDKTVERIFASYDKKDLDKIFYDFVYDNSALLDANPVPLDDIIPLLFSIDERGS